MKRLSNEELEFLAVASRAMETTQDEFIDMFEADIKAGLLKERQGI